MSDSSVTLPGKRVVFNQFNEHGKYQVPVCLLNKHKDHTFNELVVRVMFPNGHIISMTSKNVEEFARTPINWRKVETTRY